MTLMTNHPTPQDREETEETPALQGFAGYMTHDSFSKAASSPAGRVLSRTIQPEADPFAEQAKMLVGL